MVELFRLSARAVPRANFSKKARKRERLGAGRHSDELYGRARWQSKSGRSGVNVQT
jgi:hypothetical protein